MPLDPEFLHYPARKYGMDHDRYGWSMLTDRPAVRWPGNRTLALWVTVPLQFFPLDPQRKPIAIPGNMTTAYPDLRHFSLRDYGNRVGIFRILKLLDQYGIVPTFVLNGQLAQRAPYLFDRVRERGNEIAAHSWNMDCAHAGGVDATQESEWISRTLEALTAHGDRVRGWVSPGKIQSERTPELLKASGIEYQCDWVNDDMPYRFATQAGDLWSVPLSTELEDRFVILDNLHPESSWADQVCDAADFLLAEADEQGGRMLGLTLHPWLMGQPHRIRHLERVLDHLSADRRIWSVGAGEMLDAFVAQQASKATSPREST
jgi:peptidoglycan/xylan/chitin deacetylase (PgdA/CDA1 family)